MLVTDELLPIHGGGCKCVHTNIPRTLCCVIAELQISDIQEMLGDAVNNLVKHFYKPEKEVSVPVFITASHMF